MVRIYFIALVAVATAGQTRPIGVVQSVDLTAKKIVLKTDAGPELDVLLSDATKALEIAPGAKDLSGAASIELTSLNPGDRVLVRGEMAADQKSIPATQIIVMTKTALASKQEAERSEWDRGALGTVTSVDAAAKKIEIEVRSGVPGTPSRPMTLQFNEKSVVRRYAADSVKFADAQPAGIADVKTGDQIRARGVKSADGSSLAVTEAVAGTFRNLAATIVSLDTAAGSLKVTDLDSKKPLLIKITADSRIRRMPEQMARFMAMRANAGQGNAGGGMPAGPPGSGPAPGGPRPGSPGMGGPGPGGPRVGGPGAGGPGSGGGMMRPQGPAQMLERMPTITLNDLKAGDAVIIASTAGKSDAELTAITILSGVEPILTAPSKNRQMMLGDWNLDMNMGMGMGTP